MCLCVRLLIRSFQCEQDVQDGIGDLNKFSSEYILLLCISGIPVSVLRVTLYARVLLCCDGIFRVTCEISVYAKLCVLAVAIEVSLLL